MTTVMVFDGQGSEFAGMGRLLYTKSLIFKQNIDAANACLDFDLPGYLFGHTPLVAQPAALQPALVAYQYALVQAAGVRPDCVVGLSLGEYTAALCAGMLSMQAALILVAARGQAMAAACRRQPGGMLAIRLRQEAQLAVVRSWPGVWVANRNAPTQIVIGGAPEALGQARELARQAGLKALPLAVAGAFHTPLMASAQPALHEALAAQHWQAGHTPLISTTTQRRLTPANVVATLTAQVATGTDLAQTLAGLGLQAGDRLIEVGPRAVLRKQLLRQCPGVAITVLEDDTVGGERNGSEG